MLLRFVYLFVELKRKSLFNDVLAFVKNSAFINESSITYITKQANVYSNPHPFIPVNSTESNYK